MMKQMLIGLVVFFLLTTCAAGWLLYSKTVDFNALQQENIELELDKAELRDDYDKLDAELSQIREVYPLKDFATYTELEQWVKSNIQPVTPYATGSLQSAVRVVQLGEEQGYRISINIEYFLETDRYLIGCNAFAGSTLYWWNPESGNIYPWSVSFY